MTNLPTPLRPSRKDAIVRLLVEERVAALRNWHASPEDAPDLFAAGVADGIASVAKWLGVSDEVDRLVSAQL